MPKFYDDDENYESQVSRYLEILRTVAEMRAAQRRYFKSRDKADLLEAKRLEADVDQNLRDEGIHSTLP